MLNNTKNIEENQVNCAESAIDILKHARGYAEKGWAVFPCNIEKKPLTHHGFKDASTDPDTINSWWQEHPKALIGFAVPEDVLVLDIDLPEGPENLKKLEETHGPLPDTLRQKTGGGGYQYFFRLSKGVTAKNSASKIAKDIDTRTNGGYSILPPSWHPSGGTYKWANKTDMALCPGWILEALKDPKPEPRREPYQNFFADASHPYIQAAIDSEIQNLVGTPEGQRNNALNIAAVKIGHFVGSGCLSYQEAENLLLDAAEAIGLPHGGALKTIKSGLQAGSRDPKGVPDQQKPFAAFAAFAPNETNQKKWESPISLDENIPTAMNQNILPGPVGDMARAVSIETETPIELATGIGLAVLATAIQGKIIIKIKPGYTEPLNIWSVVALDPANRKTSVLSKMTSPLTEWEKAQHKKMEPWIKESVNRRQNQEARIKALRASYGKAKKEDLPGIEAEIFEIENELEEIPVIPKKWAQDVTPEHLGTLMAMHNERMSLISAEGGIFDIAAGRYSNGIPNLDMFLQGHAGDAVRVDRGSREPVYMDHPALTFGLSPQPGVLRGLADKPGFRARGLLARFLYFLPSSKLGYRSLDTSPVRDTIKNNYHQLIFQLLDIEQEEDEHGEKMRYTLTLSQGAYQEWADFFMVVEQGLREGERFEYIRDWAGKLPGAAARIAGLLHCADNPCEPWAEPVSLKTMVTALDIAAVFADHALIAFDLMGTDNSLDGARKIWRWIEKNRFEEFTKRDCFNALKSTFHRVANIEDSLKVLEERNYIQAETKKTGGRPSIRYRVNPEIIKGWS